MFAGKSAPSRPTIPPSEVAQLTVLAEDGLQDLRMTRRTRTFSDVLHRRHRRPDRPRPRPDRRVDLDGPTRAVVGQLNLSDLAFLRGLARSDGGEVWLEGTTLHLARRRRPRPGRRVRLSYGGNLIAFSVRADLAHQVSEIAVTGWSVADKDADRRDRRLRRPRRRARLADRRAPSVLADTFGERTERVVRAEPLASDDARALGQGGLPGAGPALRLRHRRHRRHPARPGRRPGRPWTGWAPMFDGDYRVTRTRHRFDLRHGYRTEFDVERAGIGATS